MFVNGKELVALVKEEGPIKEYGSSVDYEVDCFNVAKLILYLLKNGTMDNYLQEEGMDTEDHQIRNQIKRVCNLYGIKI
tara:strand:+ start:1777 stop:2013 length:237 start_codon:yes stop_codon:yes gene_type:complete